jgi:cysteine-rich repeat protein
VELCGDGLRYSLECDDGNNIDGDGCSRDCRIEPGYQCTGGSPASPDSCYYFVPNQVAFQTMGQIRMSSSVVINLKLNYLPSELLASSDCSNQCNQFLTGAITSGDTSSISITSQYLPGSNYLFIVTVQFGKPLIAPFNLNVGINKNFMKYFGSIPVQACNVAIQPSQLSAVSDVDTLS